MKKFYTFLVILCITIVCAIPASAANYGGVDLPDLPDSPYDSYSTTIYYSFDEYHVVYSPTQGVYSASMSGWVTHSPAYRYSLNSGSWSERAKNTQVNMPGDGIIWTDATVYDGAGNVFYEASSLPVCDGTSCPATDLNADGICDDCGRVLSLRAPDMSYPPLPEVSGNNMHSVVIRRPDSLLYIVFTSNTPYSISGTVADLYTVVVANEQKVDFITYKCTDGENWVYGTSGTAYQTTIGPTDSTLLASTFDWSRDGEHFFPEPPSLTEAIAEALDRMVAEMGQTVMTLLTVAVGCLALLIGLVLLVRKFRRFLP